jgi:hypothetical protein
MAVCPFELGDTILKDGIRKTVTDILTVHSLKTGQVVFLYELDNSGHQEQIRGKVERVGETAFRVTEV